ncbi:hypothetical protein ACN28I_29085 [Archangium gephyra]|uniref:hypothetical protein n=1 Tax=Archangium gephyra TaxID=48 RepID=UPI003B77AC18
MLLCLLATSMMACTTCKPEPLSCEGTTTSDDHRPRWLSIAHRCSRVLEGAALADFCWGTGCCCSTTSDVPSPLGAGAEGDVGAGCVRLPRITDSGCTTRRWSGGFGPPFREPPLVFLS